MYSFGTIVLIKFLAKCTHRCFDKRATNGTQIIIVIIYLFFFKFIYYLSIKSLCVLIGCIRAAFPSSMRRALLWRAVSSRGCAFWGRKQPNKRGLASNAAPSLNFPRPAQITSSPFLAPVAPKCRRWRPESDVEGAPLRRDWLSCSEAAVGAQRQRLRGGTCSE